MRTLAFVPACRMDPPPGALPPMRMTASWIVRIAVRRGPPHTRLWGRVAPRLQAPLGSTGVPTLHRRRRPEATAFVPTEGRLTPRLTPARAGLPGAADARAQERPACFAGAGAG